MRNNEKGFAESLLIKLDLTEYAALNNWDQLVSKLDLICTESQLEDKDYIVIEAANDLVTSNQNKYFNQVLKWANLIDKNTPDLFTQIQLAELRKRVLLRQGDAVQAEAMAAKEKELRAEAGKKSLMTPPLRAD